MVTAGQVIRCSSNRGMDYPNVSVPITQRGGQRLRALTPVEFVFHLLKNALSCYLTLVQTGVYGKGAGGIACS